MVLEHLVPEKWLERRFSLSLFLGFGFTLVGVILARLLFGANSGLVAVFFVSLLLIPSLKKLFKEEDQLEEREKRFSFKELWKDNKHLIFTYAGMFLGVYIATYLITYFSYYFGFDAVSIFREQLYLEPAISGRATFFGPFWEILSNNWWVLLATFLLALISGDGATFFVVWNASAWAAIFAFRSFAAATVLPVGFLEVALLLQLIVLPHLLIEGLAYILAGIAGSVISQDVVSESAELRSFLGYFAIGIIAFVFLNFIITRLTSLVWLSFLLRLAFTLGIVWFFHQAFTNKKHQEVFLYNYWLFIIAIAVFLLGVAIETLVLTNSGLLAQYYAAAYALF